MAFQVSAIDCCPLAIALASKLMPEVINDGSHAEEAVNSSTYEPHDWLSLISLLLLLAGFDWNERNSARAMRRHRPKEPTV